MDDLLHDPLLRDLTLERVVNYALEFIKIVGMNQEFTEKVEKLNVRNYRALLPCDFHEMIQVINENGYSYRNSTDSFHMSRHEHKHVDLTYKLQNNYIYTNVKDDTIQISYKALELDEDGFPLIPDLSSFIRALRLYIEKQETRILFRQGKLNALVYQDSLQEYAWAVGLALSDLVKLNLDKSESVSNIWNNHLLKQNDHNFQYVNSGSKEYIKSH